MRHRGIRALALGLACGLLAIATGPASAAREPADAGHAIGHAGSAAVMLRLLPGSIPETSILPDLAQLPSGDRPFDAGYGLATTQLNTNAALPYERSIAQATPEGSLFGDVETPTGGFLVQTAAPDNAEPTTERLRAPDSPADALVSVGDTTATVHARWSEDDGPCVDTASRASTTTDRLAAGSAIPTLPDIDVTDLPLPKNARAAGFRPDGGIGTLGGLLSGEQREDGDGALLRVPDGFDTTSDITVVDAPASDGKAVRSTSTVRTEAIELLPGSPLGMTATVRREASLAVTATGDTKTSEVDFEDPTITVTRGDTELFTLNGRNRTKDIPIGVPTPALYEHTKTKLAPVPIVAGAAQTAKGTRLTLTGPARRAVTDLFVLRLSVGGLNQTSAEMDSPITGTEFAASARLLDVQLLPTRALADAMASGQGDVAGLPYDVPSTLAQYSLGEQTAGALVAEGGVECGTIVADAPSGNAVPSAVGIPSPAAISVPLLWVGSVAVLIGVALLTVPFRTPRRTTPSPVPRE
ncbi:MAG: hypothetical protein GEV04_15465 [Actinophytocola sp.]|nr:hypothetical protein [Actinophytocola sp.]